MAYRISGLDPAPFVALADLDEDALAERGVRRVVADANHGFPCRVSLEDARAGETLLLLNHASHDVATPYRSTFAIYVREGAVRAATCIDASPPVFAGRPLALRGYDREGNLRDARLALPQDGCEHADGPIRALFANPDIAYIHAHNAAHGCFAAAIERHGEFA